MPNEFFASDNFSEYARKSQNGKLLQQGNEMNVLQSQKKMPCVFFKINTQPLHSLWQVVFT